jgi:hypothetical protein
MALTLAFTERKGKVTSSSSWLISPAFTSTFTLLSGDYDSVDLLFMSLEIGYRIYVKRYFYHRPSHI